MPSIPSTFPELLDQLVRPRADRVFLPRRTAQDHSAITFGRLADDVDALAASLLALGIRRGDHVGLVAENRYEWLLIDLAMASLGVVDVPRGSDTTPTELQFILRHSGSRAAFAESDQVASELLAMRPELTALEHVIVMADRTDVDGALALGDLLRQGADEPRDALRRARAEVTGDDLLTIVYTSGTTAEPKGVMLTHLNVISNIRTCTDVLHVTDRDSFLSVLPAWHMYERIMDYLALATGGQLVYTDRRRIKEDLQTAQPTIFAAVPRIWEMLHDGVVNHALKLDGMQG
ncbi:MAG: AMP-binding protein, partial [Planctomycetes bacterium]|nr:AMP-binding protein [Planctomycetota bacterium]